MATALAALLSVAVPSKSAAAPAAVTRYEGGQVWTGSGFDVRDLAVRDGRFVDPAPASRGAARVDLGGSYVVPALANAHAHATPADPAGSRAFTDAGVFYAWNPNTTVMGDAARAFWARPDTYDVRIAQGGVSEPDGHPEALYLDVLSRYFYGGKPRGWFVGNAYHYGRTTAEIDAALDRLTAQKADFVKAYLLHSEDYAKRVGKKRFHGARGMSPAMFAYLVSAAAKRGLRVAAHVETVADLRLAATSGAYMAAHLPGYAGSTSARDLAAKQLTAADAALVARSGMLVVPTYSVIHGDPFNAWDEVTKEATARELAMQSRNIGLLQAAGARILIGTDGRGAITLEVEHLVRIGALGPREATAAALGTGARLFPERRIGCFDVGCEADFLVLGADPTVDIKALRQIERRVMQGRALPAPKPASAPQSGWRWLGRPPGICRLSLRSWSLSLLSLRRGPGDR